mmetsp:Transcript_18382/g.47108  ORF Transcript_18382/g.47108 Transcript_18382/m.47108 type:complete len:134 (-) Transcript_18382:605-1006(-)
MVSDVVDRVVDPTRRVHVENPSVLFERSAKAGTIEDSSVRDDVFKAFVQAGKNLCKFYSQFIHMPKLKTSQLTKSNGLWAGVEKSSGTHPGQRFSKYKHSSMHVRNDGVFQPRTKVTNGRRVNSRCICWTLDR